MMQRYMKKWVSSFGMLLILVASVASAQQWQRPDGNSGGQSHKAQLQGLFQPIGAPSLVDQASRSNVVAPVSQSRQSHQVRQAGYLQPTQQPPNLNAPPLAGGTTARNDQFAMPGPFAAGEGRGGSGQPAANVSDPPSLAQSYGTNIGGQPSVQPAAAAAAPATPTPQATLWDEANVATVANSPHVTGPIQFASAQTYAGDPCQPIPTVPYAAPATVVPPTVTPGIAPQYFVGNEPGYGPLLTLGQEANNVVLGRGIIGQPVAYVPGQYLRNFLRYISP